MLGHLRLGVQLRIQLVPQHLQLPIAFHFAELLFCFDEAGGGPAGDVVATLPGFHVVGHVG